ncbi:MAG: tetratricopeptide repeat protein, partial [Candidatus Thorarchaeota archaeon]
MKMKDVPPEFGHFLEESMIPWEDILKSATQEEKEGKSRFSAFTDVVIDIATKESMKESAKSEIIRLGLEAALVRGKLAQALFLSTDSDNIAQLSLKAMVMFVLSDIDGLRTIESTLSGLIDENSSPSDRVRLSTAKVFLTAAERDTSVIMCIMEFDNLLESYPEQVEDPLIETMFTLYVVGTLLREVGQTTRASRIADTLEDMAKAKEHRMVKALVENLRGNICNFQGNFEQAEEHYLRLQKISQDLNFNLGLGMAYNNLGTLKLNCLRLEDALVLFERSYELLDMDRGKLVALANMGQLAMMLGKNDQAEHTLLEAIRLEEKTQSDTIEVYSWYAILLSRMKRFSEAQTYLQKAYEIEQRTEKPMQKGVYLHAKGVNHALLEEYELAVSSFDSEIKIAKDNDIFEMLVSAKLELARTYLEAHEKSQDIEYLSNSTYQLDDVVQIAKEQGLQSLYAEALLLRSDIFRIGMKDFEAKVDLERVVSVASFLEDTRLLTSAKDRLTSIAAAEKTKSLEQGEIEKSIDRLAGFKPAGKLRSVPFPTLHTLLALDRRSGLPQYVHPFGDEMGVDSSIISGFIAAIASFTNEFMGDRGLL